MGSDRAEAAIGETPVPAERERLLRDMHHKIQNTLQLVSAMLYFQARHLSSPELTGVVERNGSRIQVLALVHRHVTVTNDGSRVSSSDYVSDLVLHTYRSLKADAARIKVEMDVAEALLPIEVALPWSLILNELLTNAFVHAFPAGRSGTISIELERSDRNGWRLDVQDDGIGWPGAPDWPRTAGFGLGFAGELLQEIRGSLTGAVDSGTRFRLEFTEPDGGAEAISSSRPAG